MVLRDKDTLSDQGKIPHGHTHTMMIILKKKNLTISDTYDKMDELIELTGKHLYCWLTVSLQGSF